MWFVIAWLTLLPLGWALAGAPTAPGPATGSALPAGTGQAAPLATGWLGLAVAFGVLLALGPARRYLTHVGTVVHEFGHALTAAALRGQVARITMAPDGSGQATTGLPSRARVRWSLVALSGYLAPGVIGLASLRMAQAGLGEAWLGFISVVTLLMLVLSLRSWWAILVAVLVVAAGGLVVTQTSAAWATAAAAALAGVLLARGVGDAATQYQIVARSPGRGQQRTDAGNLARQTGLPARLFAGLQLVLSVGLAAAGLWLLLPWAA